MPLTLKQIDNVCLRNGGLKRCRFLAQDDEDWGKYKYYCTKLTYRKDAINDEVRELTQQMKSRGQDINKTNLALGDNCSGYPILKFIDQGYDV